jgi:hypothetical protein
VADGLGLALSSDGEWVISLDKDFHGPLVLSPKRAGERRTIGLPAMHDYRGAKWIPGTTSVIFSAATSDNTYRLYIQDLATALPPQPTCMDGLAGPAAVSPDGKTYLAIRLEDRSTWLCAVGGGAATRLTTLTADDFPFQWAADGGYILIRRRGGEVPLTITRVGLHNGQRQPFAQFKPSDPAGVTTVQNAVLTPDGRAYAYSYIRVLSDLYVFKGLN